MALEDRAKKRRGRLALRILVRASAALALCAAALGVRVYFFPFSFELLNERVIRDFRRATGWDLDFAELKIHLAQGTFALSEVALRAADDNEVLAGARQLEIEPAWSGFLRPDFSHIRTARIAEPRPFALTADANGVRPAGLLARLFESGAPGQAPSAPAQFQVDSLLARQADFTIQHPETGRLLARGENASLSGRWSGAQDFSFTFRGDFRVGEAPETTRWGAYVQSLPDDDGFAFHWEAARIPEEVTRLARLNYDLEGERVRIGGSIRPREKPEGLTAGLTIEAAELRLVDHATSDVLRVENLALAMEVAHEPSSATLLVSLSDARAMGFEAEGVGRIGTASPFPYEIDLTRVELPEASLLRVLEFEGDLDRIVALRTGSAVGEARLRGPGLGSAPSQLDATLQLRDVSVDLRSPPMALTGLTGELRTDGKTLKADALKGRYRDSGIEITGTLSSEADFGLLKGKPRSAELDWRVDGRSEDFAHILAPLEAPALHGLKTSGRVRGDGLLSADFGTTPTWENAANSLVMAGSAQLNDFALEHPALPGPLEKVSGFIEVKNHELRFRDLTGAFLGSTASVSGVFQGRGLFWNEPEVDLSIVSDMDLARVAPVIESWLGQDGALPLLVGKVRSEIQLKGNLTRPGTLTYFGDLAFDQLATEIRSPGFNGRIANLRGALSLQPDRLVFTGLDFEMGGARYTTSGELGRADLKGDIRLAGPMRAIKNAHPVVFDPFEVDGEMELTARFHLALPGPERSVALNDARFPPVFAFPEGVAALAKRSFDGLQVAARLMEAVEGEAKLRGVEMTYCTFPARVTDVNGTMRISREGFHGKDVSLKMGGYPATGSGDYLLSRDGHRRFTYHLAADRMDVKPWYGRWPEPPPQFAYQPLKPGVDPFIKSTTHAFADIKEARLDQFRFSNHKAEFYFENWKGPDNVMEIRNLRADAYGGHGSAKGVITFPRESRMRWDTNIEVADVELKEALPAVFQRPTEMSGRVNTTLRFAGVAGSTESFRGQGHLVVLRPNFFGPAVMAPIQDALRLGRLGDAVFPRLEGDYIFRDGYVESDRLMMGNEMVHFVAEGRVWFDQRLDLTIYAQPLGGLGWIPFMGPVEKAVDWISAALFKFHVQGSLENPAVRPVPLSVDRLNPLNLIGGRRDERRNPAERGR